MTGGNGVLGGVICPKIAQQDKIKGQDMPKFLQSEFILRSITAAFLLFAGFVIYDDPLLAILIGLGFGGFMALEIALIAGWGWSLRSLVFIFVLVSPSLAEAFFIEANSYLVLLVALVFLVLVSKRWAQGIMSVATCLAIFCFVAIRLLDMGGALLLSMALVVAAVDSAAYVGGRLIGGARFAPSISPSKTWSGSLSGLAAGVLVTVLIGASLGYSAALMVFVGFLGSCLAIYGDLLESWFKRQYGIKDSSQFLPGHGGFLDRFDGYLFVLPCFYILLLLGG